MDIRELLASQKAEHEARNNQHEGDPLLLERGMVEASANAIVTYRDTGAEVVKAVRDYSKESDSTYFIARHVLASEIGNAFGVVTSFKQRSKEIIWWGFDADIDMVEDLFDLLEPQMMMEALAFNGFGSESLRKQREDFALGFARKVGARLAEYYRQSGASQDDKDWRDVQVRIVLPRMNNVAIRHGSAAGAAAGARADITLNDRKLAA